MRILALDYGTKRVGVAVSDTLKMIAQPLEYLDAVPFPALVEHLRRIIKEQEVELIVIGMPRNMDGTYGDSAARVREFVAAIKDVIVVPLKTWDERLTTAQANRALIQGNVRRGNRKQKIDMTAAAILLQSYLDHLSMQ
jgi:putative Holliday junction resolvase